MTNDKQSNDGAPRSSERTLEGPGVTDTPTPVIFIDVDGVLISDQCYLTSENDATRHDPECAQRVRALCKTTRAQLVWNTTWNAQRETLNAFAKATGLDQWQAPQDRATTLYGTRVHDRLDAIRMWGATHASARTPWVALDDERIAHANAVHVNRTTGVSDADCVRAIAILAQQEREEQ